MSRKVDECKPLVRGVHVHRGVVQRRNRRRRHGGAVQVDPTRLMLKAPGTKPLKLKYDKLLSRFAFKFTLRRYTMAAAAAATAAAPDATAATREEAVGALRADMLIGPWSDIVRELRRVVETVGLARYICPSYIESLTIRTLQ